MDKINQRALRLLPYTMIAQILGTLLLSLCMQLVPFVSEQKTVLLDYPVIITSVNLVVTLFNFSFLWFCQFGVRKLNGCMQAAFWVGTASTVTKVFHAILYSLMFIRLIAGKGNEYGLIYSTEVLTETGSFLLGVSMILTIHGLRIGSRETMTKKAGIFCLAGEWSIAAMMVVWRAWRLAGAIRQAREMPMVSVFLWYLLSYDAMIVAAGGAVTFVILLCEVHILRRTHMPAGKTPCQTAIRA